ncbi:Trp biosynthesis-associated membrane protein [Sinomonas atrocyanea]|uniref:Trp biosynthesis-associated membrane protein n=1 Tax=Sinomonas atrocyanea TaxID=37927 RepID=UPI002780C8EF|nr:Trp biosynthesis-associated membrane protein [Sinomonas atrocyanea]MDQ0259949.1 putative membrane protein (TIGR02234 family) [Sinomonas atrocyanea]MDR6619970.1 putative membrane protein (TIGR02234 family) [Sinomonas atrocyanea]
MAETSVRSPRPVPRWARKPIVVVVALAFALLAFGATTQVWVDAEVQGSAVRTAHLSVQGSKAATSVSALALVGLAGTLAAAVAGRVGRAVASAVVVLAGAGVAAACAAVLADPRGAAEGSIAQATGLAGSQASVALTPYPALAAAAGALLALSGILLLVAARRWPLRTRYDAGRASAARGAAGTDADRAGAVDGIDGWDSLSRGEDPTD